MCLNNLFDENRYIYIDLQNPHKNKCIFVVYTTP